MKIVGIIQCRTGSKRLPNKALLPLADKPLLYRFIERVKKAERLHEVILATTEKPEDDCLCDVAEELGVESFRGSENDLVDRFYQCAKKYKVDAIVRLCADNPLIEAVAIDVIVLHALKSDNGRGLLFSNTQDIKGNGFPDGLGAEVFSFGFLEWLWNNISDEELREHPHLYFYQNDLVETCECPDYLKYPHIKLDVNTQEEYERVKDIYDEFGPDCHFTDYIKSINKEAV